MNKLPIYIYDNILNNIIVYILCDKFNYKNNYLIDNYKLYNDYIIQLCLVSKQFFKLVSSNISYKLYCENKLDEWVDKLYYKRVNSRLFNIINNDTLGELSITTQTFNSYINGYLKYMDKIQNNSKYNNNDNNSGSFKNKIIINLNKNCYNEAIEIVKLNQDIPSHVEFRLKFYLSFQTFNNKDSAKDVLEFYKFLSIANVRDIDVDFYYVKKDKFNCLEFFKINQLESLVLNSIFQVNWAPSIHLSPNLKQLSISLPIHDIIRSSQLPNRDLTTQSIYKCVYMEASVSTPTRVNQDWDILVERLKQNSTLINFTIKNLCSSETLCLNNVLDLYLSSPSSINILTSGLKSILTSPNTSIRYLCLVKFDFIDNELLHGISNCSTLKSLELSPRKEVMDSHIINVIKSVSLNQNILYLKLGMVSIDKLHEAISSLDNSLYLESISLIFILSHTKSLLDLLDDNKCKIKEFNLFIYASTFNLRDKEFKSTFDYSLKRSHIYNKKKINIHFIHL